MIAVSLCGGLGNQMLQYAAGLRLARKHGTDLRCDLSWYTNAEGVTVAVTVRPVPVPPLVAPAAVGATV